ncbi:MAG: tetratricopeptide repeat protein [Deltaproteobacteria bacterium]|nr:tetratricopeptide repeat protein [Deltaproteobacteria bacterium]MBW2024506.1 tetratricopeptide repeat protein [Deltaproteobacteria bacterium]MBW2125145.1 tetratricopeptide repeat protein [Deltaproteobacteria bacterium]
MSTPSYRKKKRPKSRGNRIAIWILCLFILALGALGWWIWAGMHAASPRLESVLLSINDQSQRLLNTEQVTIHPQDRIKILKISTNVPLNMGIRLFCKGLDAQALVYEEMRLMDLLPEKVIFQNPALKIHVKHYNQDAGYVIFQVKPFVGDWLEKASRTIDQERRIKVLEEALRKVPDSEEIRQRLLKEYLKAGKLDRASKMLEKMAKRRPSKELLHQLLGLYKKMGSDKGVVSVLKRLIQLNPKDLEPRYALAEFMEKKGKLSKAIAQYRAILKIAPPENRFDLYVQLGYLNAKIGKIKQAIYYYEKAAALHKKDENLYYNLSYLYEKLGKKDVADSYLEKALRLKSSDLEGRIKLAERWIERGKFKKAKVLLNQVLKKRPNNLKALLLMMKVAEKKGTRAELKGIYRKILKLKPNNATVLYNLGALEYEDGQLKSAANHLKRYITAHPKDKAAHSLLFDIYKGMGKADRAAKEAKTLLSLGVADFELYDYLFEYLKDKRDYGQLEALMKKGVKRYPKNAQLRKYLLFAYLSQDKEEEAMAEMEQILKLEPKNVELWFHLAKLREKHERYGEAMAAYKRVVELAPDNDEAAEAYLKLRLRGFEEKARE